MSEGIKGWKLVPIVPTPKMIDSTWDEVRCVESHNARNKRVYAAMLAAAPEPSVGMEPVINSFVHGPLYSAEQLATLQAKLDAEIDMHKFSVAAGEDWHKAFLAEKANLERAEKDKAELVELLGNIFQAYEYGTPCNEEDGGYIGNAFNMDDDIFQRTADILNRLETPAKYEEKKE